jgi:hypothetical protein
MPEKMIFRPMIEQFGVPFTAFVEISEGHYQDGDWLEGEKQPVPSIGVILPLSEDDLEFAGVSAYASSEIRDPAVGSYSVKDRKLYTTQPLKLGQKITYKNITYTILNFKDYSDYADVFIYVARWAGNENSSP